MDVREVINVELLFERKRRKKKKKRDACYYKVKSRYDVWPSAYASGALSKCRKVGASNWGNSTKEEENHLEEKWSEKYKKSINCNNPKGFSQKAHCQGRNKNESIFDLENLITEKRKLTSKPGSESNLRDWFNRKGAKGSSGGWVDCNTCRKDSETGRTKCKPCGRQEGESRSKYPACRPTPGSCKKYKSSKGKSWGKKTKTMKEDYIINGKLITEGKELISENVVYHFENRPTLTENIYRYGSEGYFKLINEVRSLYNKGIIDLSLLDEELVHTDIGRRGIYENKVIWLDVIYEGEEEVEIINEAEYQGKKVSLGKPKRGGSKKFYVYTKCGDKVKKVSFGAKSGGGKLAVKLRDPKARKAFSDRHRCPQKNDKCSAGYWACRLPRYAKSLGLSGGGTWW
jgi:hypothetical protein